MSQEDEDTTREQSSQPTSPESWIDKLTNLQKFIVALTAVVVALGGLVGAIYGITRSFSGTVAGAPTSSVASKTPTDTSTASPSPSASSSSPSPSPTSTIGPNAIGDARISKVVSASGASCIGGTVQVTTEVTSPASPDRELWLMAVVISGIPSHPVYYAKRMLTNSPVSQQVIIAFIGSAIGSSRNLIVVSAGKEAVGWLKKNLAHDGGPTWDIHRVKLPADVAQISRPYKVTTTC